MLISGPPAISSPICRGKPASLLLDDTLTEAAGLARNYGSEMDAYAGSY
ncbi:hypothetical protein ACFQT0_29105 [Hymenobacter humi]|uniref:Uncharacterized protein n=1 Tax=Hymenobacter humi TaxID=1411620 RepID=A0ABW2UFB3_9BACT